VDLVRLLIQSGSFGALAAVLVAMVLRGDVVPRRTYDDIVRDRDAWRTAHGVSEEGRHEALRQTREMLEVVHTANHVLASLPQAAAGEVSHADSHLAPPPA
jgi:hypothetical protein